MQIWDVFPIVVYQHRILKYNLRQINFEKMQFGLNFDFFLIIWELEISPLYKVDF